MEPSMQSAGIFPLHFLPAATVVRSPQVTNSPGTAVAEAKEQTCQAQLDQRLAAVLRGLVNGFASDAADFYLLNGASDELVLRAHYQADDREPAAERRSLRTARADVAAMAGSAIVLEDERAVADWPVPVWCGAAICLPVASDQTIHGSLWLYFSEAREFADAEIELAEIVAGRLALEIELRACRAESHRLPPRAHKPADAAVRETPSMRLAPPVAPPLEEWELAGWTSNAEAGRSFYDWQTLADGRTLVVSGAMADSTWLAATSDAVGVLRSARIALRAHAAETLDAGELLTRVNQTLWTASPGGEGLALAVAMLDSDGAHASVALAGASAALRWRASSCEWEADASAPVGWSEQTVYVGRQMELRVRERLVLMAAGDAALGNRALAPLSRALRATSSSEWRSLPGKRALRIVAAAAADCAASPGGLALVRRR